MTTATVPMPDPRKGWRRHRYTLGLLDTTPTDQFARGGIAALAKPLDVRVVVLPADPEATSAVPLDGETDTWLSAERPSPYGGRQIPWGHTNHASSHALARATSYRDDELWDRYLAVHRHGGIEAGHARMSWEVHNRKAFALRQAVATIWVALALQVEAAERWSVAGPWEITLALRATSGATLGDFAEGWAQVGDLNHGGQTCGEPSILHRWEVDVVVPEAIAFDAGARLENSFGTTHRRHIAHRGDFEGRFDPRFGW